MENNPTITLTEEQAEPIRKWALKVAKSEMKKVENRFDEKDLFDRFYNWKLGAEAVRQYLKIEKPMELKVGHGKQFKTKPDFLWFMKAVKVLTVQNIQKYHIIRKHYDFPFFFVFVYRVGESMKFEIVGCGEVDVLNDENNHSSEFKYGTGLIHKDKTCFTGYNQLSNIDEFAENYLKQIAYFRESGMSI